MPQEGTTYIVWSMIKLANRRADKIVFDNFEAHQLYLASIDCVHFEWEE